MTPHRITLIGHLALGVEPDDLLANALQVQHPRALIESSRVDRVGAHGLVQITLAYDAGAGDGEVADVAARLQSVPGTVGHDVLIHFAP